MFLMGSLLQLHLAVWMEVYLAEGRIAWYGAMQCSAVR